MILADRITSMLRYRLRRAQEWQEGDVDQPRDDAVGRIRGS
jgi:hypothetical protein